VKSIVLLALLTSLLLYGDDAPGTALSGKGKFVFGQVSSFARGQYMLNTETGELWNIQRDDNNISVLQRIFFSCIDKDYKSQYCFSPVLSKEEDLKIKFGKK
jgi:hypothetical protein